MRINAKIVLEPTEGLTKFAPNHDGPSGKVQARRAVQEKEEEKARASWPIKNDYRMVAIKGRAFARMSRRLPTRMWRHRQTPQGVSRYLSEFKRPTHKVGSRLQTNRGQPSRRRWPRQPSRRLFSNSAVPSSHGSTTRLDGPPVRESSSESNVVVQSHIVPDNPCDGNDVSLQEVPKVVQVTSVEFTSSTTHDDVPMPTMDDQAHIVPDNSCVAEVVGDQEAHKASQAETHCLAFKYVIGSSQ